MRRICSLLLSICFLTACNTNNHADVENQAVEIIEKVQYDERKLEALEQNSKPPLEIREETINIAQSVISQDDRVKDIRIESDSMNISISLLINELISNDEATEIGVRAAQHLSSFAEGGKLIKTGELGELYDYYNLEILIGKDRSKPIIRGEKQLDENSINWK